MEVCRKIEDDMGFSESGKRMLRQVCKKPVYVVLCILLGNCGGDPDIPVDHSSYISKTLPVCTIDVKEIVGNQVVLQIAIERTEATDIEEMKVCFSRSDMMPDTTCTVVDIIHLFNGKEESSGVFLSDLDYSSEYACRIYLANRKEHTYSPVMRFITGPTDAIQLWRKMGVLPTNEGIYNAVTKVGKRVFLLSDYSYTTSDNPALWKYNAVSNNWTFLTSTPIDGSALSVCIAIGDKLYTGLRDGISYDNKSWWCYDPMSNKWIRKKDFTGPVNDVITCFSVAGKGYVITESRALSGPNMYRLDLYAYSPQSDSWQIKASLPGTGSEGYISSCVVGERAFVAGGNYYVNQQMIVKDNVWEYDHKNDQWLERAAFGGGGRANMLLVGDDEQMYAGFGFKNGEGTKRINMYDWWSYSPEADSWTPLLDYIYWASMYFYPYFGFELDGDVYIGSGGSGSSGMWRYSEKK